MAKIAADFPFVRGFAVRDVVAPPVISFDIIWKFIAINSLNACIGDLKSLQVCANFFPPFRGVFEVNNVCV